MAGKKLKSTPSASPDARFLKEQLVDQRAAKFSSMKQEYQKIAAEDRQYRGRDYWKKVAENGEKLLEKGNEGYHDWVAGMNAICTTLMPLAKALSNDPIFNLSAWISSVADSIEIWWHSKDAPKIEFSVQVNDGQLISNATKFVSSTSTQDGEPFTDTEQAMFDTGIAAWLQGNGYKRDQDDRWVTGEKGKETSLTQARYDQLAMNPEKGLEAYFKRTHGLDIDHASVGPRRG